MQRVFPVRVAEALRREGKVADEYPEASVLFADIVGFTPAASELAPGEVVALLDEVFATLDDLVDERGPGEDQDDRRLLHGRRRRARRCGPITPRRCATSPSPPSRSPARRTFRGRSLDFRIGINSGPIVGGVIGQKRFLYDLWGDAVNVASRMQSSAEAGTIQVTDATRSLLGDDFECVDLGFTDVKGRGSMRVWRVVGSRGWGAAWSTCATRLLPRPGGSAPRRR